MWTRDASVGRSNARLLQCKYNSAFELLVHSLKIQLQTFSC